jgi:hypothetical protein
MGHPGVLTQHATTTDTRNQACLIHTACCQRVSTVTLVGILHSPISISLACCLAKLKSEAIFGSRGGLGTQSATSSSFAVTTLQVVIANGQRRLRSVQSWVGACGILGRVVIY